MAELRRADTPLAKWLANAMARWVNPETQMPGLSQRKLAERAGISQTQVHEILKKGHSPSPDTLIKLADFYGVNPLMLFRLAYIQEEEDVEAGVSTRLLELFLELEELLSKLPREEQLAFYEEFAKDAKVLALSIEAEE